MRVREEPKERAHMYIYMTRALVRAEVMGAYNGSRNDLFHESRPTTSQI